MIAVISSGAFLKGALQYNFNKVEQGNAAVISANNIMTPDDIAGTNMEMVMQSFLPNIENNNRTKKYHFFLQPGPSFR
jgi:dihydroxyacetone kinase-like predicted kinase